MQLYHAKKFNNGKLHLLTKDSKPFVLPVKNIELIDPDADLSHLSLEDGMWMLPKSFNQGGYDAVYIYNGEIVFVQIASSAKHDLNLDPMKELYRKLCPKSKRTPPRRSARNHDSAGKGMKISSSSSSKKVNSWTHALTHSLTHPAFLAPIRVTMVCVRGRINGRFVSDSWFLLI
jgi:hypothetical protein